MRARRSLVLDNLIVSPGIHIFDCAPTHHSVYDSFRWLLVRKANPLAPACGTVHFIMLSGNSIIQTLCVLCVCVCVGVCVCVCVCVCVYVYNDVSMIFQVIVAGQGLNDDMWHTLRFTRRANSIKFQVDDEVAIKGNKTVFLYVWYSFLEGVRMYILNEPWAVN